MTPRACHVLWMKADGFACSMQVLGDLLVYPNRMSFDIMPGGGKAPEPVGLLVLKVKAVTNLKGGGDLFSKVHPSSVALLVGSAYALISALGTNTGLLLCCFILAERCSHNKYDRDAFRSVACPIV